MFRTNLLLAAILIFSALNGQNKTVVYNKPEQVDSSPIFPGGLDSLQNFIRENCKYPAEELKSGLEGEVYVQFDIDTLGNPTNIEVIRSVSNGLDAEAVRIVGGLKGWKPAILNSDKVPYRFVIPIVFALPKNRDKDLNCLRKEEAVDIAGNLNSIQEAHRYFYETPSPAIEVFENGSQDPDYRDLVENLPEGQLGTINSIVDGKVYKVFSYEVVTEYRVSYIYFNAREMSLERIDELRQQILKSYQEGESFKKLHEKYSMDPNPTGDTGWFTAGRMVPEFEEAIKLHDEGDIFKVDVPNNKWYYVVLKTFANRKTAMPNLIQFNICE